MVVALSRVTPAVVQRLQVPVQVLLYAGLFVFAEYLVDWLHLPLPANLVGMVLMLTLILCRALPLNWVRAGARWLLAEMLLFFVPAVVAVVNYAQLLMVDGWRIFAVIALSTLMVLGATAWWWIRCIALKSAGRSMTNFQISLLCLIATVVIYFANKRLYRRFRALPLMPLVFTPILLVLMLVFGHISGRTTLANPTGCCGCSARRPSPSPYPFMTTSLLSDATGCRSARASSPRRWWR